MRAGRTLVASLAVAALLGACGDDDIEPAETGEAPTTVASTTETTAGSSSTTETTSTSTTPEDSGAVAAAEAFMAAFFPGNTATVGEFRQGDARSGEVEVLRPAEGGGSANLAATLLVRLDDSDEWQVIGATSEFVTIEEPENLAEVTPGQLTVSGTGRGFEGTLNVRAATADGTALADAVAMGGSLETPEPYEAALDLSGATPGEDVFVIVAGGTGLEGDPGEFAANRLTVAE
jgi:hypothetical protein